MPRATRHGLRAAGSRTGRRQGRPAAGPSRAGRVPGPGKAFTAPPPIRRAHRTAAADLQAGADWVAGGRARYSCAHAARVTVHLPPILTIALLNEIWWYIIVNAALT